MDDFENEMDRPLEPVRRVQIDSEQYELIRSDLLVQFLSLRSWFQWVVGFLFLIFVLLLLLWFGIRP